MRENIDLNVVAAVDPIYMFILATTVDFCAPKSMVATSQKVNKAD